MIRKTLRKAARKHSCVYPNCNRTPIGFRDQGKHPVCKVHYDKYRQCPVCLNPCAGARCQDHAIRPGRSPRVHTEISMTKEMEVPQIITTNDILCIN